MHLIYLYRTFHPNAEEYTFFLKCTCDILKNKPRFGDAKLASINLGNFELHQASLPIAKI